MSGAVFRMPLSVSAQRLQRSLARISALAEAGDDAAFDAAIAEWFEDLKAHVQDVQRASGLSSAEMVELLIP